MSGALGYGEAAAPSPGSARAVAEVMDAAAGERDSGPLLLRADDKQMDRCAATRVVVRLAKKAGIKKHLSPHSLRHQGSGHGVIVCATSGPGFDLVAQGEVGAGVAGLCAGQVLAQLRDGGGGPPCW